jgi:hypothetical protein
MHWDAIFSKISYSALKFLDDKSDPAYWQIFKRMFELVVTQNFAEMSPLLKLNILNHTGTVLDESEILGPQNKMLMGEVKEGSVFKQYCIKLLFVCTREILVSLEEDYGASENQEITEKFTNTVNMMNSQTAEHKRLAKIAEMAAKRSQSIHPSQIQEWTSDFQEILVQIGGTVIRIEESKFERQYFMKIDMVGIILKHWLCGLLRDLKYGIFAKMASCGTGPMFDTEAAENNLWISLESHLAIPVCNLLDTVCRFLINILQKYGSDAEKSVAMRPICYNLFSTYAKPILEFLWKVISENLPTTSPGEMTQTQKCIYRICKHYFDRLCVILDEQSLIECFAHLDIKSDKGSAFLLAYELVL